MRAAIIPLPRAIRRARWCSTRVGTCRSTPSWRRCAAWPRCCRRGCTRSTCAKTAIASSWPSARSRCAGRPTCCRLRARRAWSTRRWRSIPTVIASATAISSRRPRATCACPTKLPERVGETPTLDDDALVAIGYTSGSTGRPQANPKTWGSFRRSTAQNLAALADLWQPEGDAHIVATVPPQHMYGMEMSVLLPLLGPVAVHAARPFFPEDVAQALSACARTAHPGDHARPSARAARFRLHVAAAARDRFGDRTAVRRARG